ncbi:MAG: hypothetical protein PHW35_06910 [Lentimicrobiaceae bacterium]|jgi:hypothetical protein|nr:hypothetical protein [Lentimicrobiaceae bacterium]MDD4597680.1 hypothetical protein [Lentimicrobiaceae bacterium]MDY0025560.1 hypothetical protein [Lentimicrobium sp.]
MQHLVYFLAKRIAAFFFISLLAILCFASCSDDKDDPGDVPKIQLNPASATAVPGSEVTTTLTMNASEGLSKLILNSNGVMDTLASYVKEQSATYVFKTIVPAAAPANSNYTYIFTALDALNRSSDPVVFTVTVSKIPPKEIVNVSGEITGNVTWSKNKIWRMQGMVKVMDNAILTIEPGTTVIGEYSSKGSLLIQQGGKLIADGSAQQPIVFTSEKERGQREAGDWGGIVICGRAINNQGSNIELEGGYGAFHGGSIANDNSGILRYVRIEFAGAVLSNNQEKNALTLASVGNGTTIEYVQCSYALDDSFEWFGGNVNARYLISYHCQDDDFDVDYGYSGNVQFAFALRGSSEADNSHSNGIEADNDGAGTSLTPITAAVFANVTIIGPKKTAETYISPYFHHAFHLRRNSAVSIYNSFATGFPIGLFIDDSKAGSSQQAMKGNLQIRNLILAGVENWGDNNWGGNSNNTNGPLKQVNASVAPGFEINTWYNTASYKNQLLLKWQDANINPAIFEVPVPTSGLLLNAADWSNTPKAGTFFEKVNFAGAIGEENWPSLWCDWTPNAISSYLEIKAN